LHTHNNELANTVRTLTGRLEQEKQLRKAAESQLNRLLYG
jgi:hypothetical protein